MCLNELVTLLTPTTRHCLGQIPPAVQTMTTDTDHVHREKPHRRTAAGDITDTFQVSVVKWMTNTKLTGMNIYNRLQFYYNITHGMYSASEQFHCAWDLDCLAGLVWYFGSTVYYCLLSTTEVHSVRNECKRPLPMSTHTKTLTVHVMSYQVRKDITLEIECVNRANVNTLHNCTFTNSSEPGLFWMDRKNKLC